MGATKVPRVGISGMGQSEGEEKCPLETEAGSRRLSRHCRGRVV